MSVMTRRPTSERSARGRGPTRPRRVAELVLAALGILLSLLSMGGFTLVMNAISLSDFEVVIMPALLGGSADMTVDSAYEMARTLAAWFGVSVVVVLLLSAAGIALTRSRPHRRTAGWWFLAAGLVCLLGSQLLLFPIAFLFFASAGLFALRPLPERSTR